MANSEIVLALDMSLARTGWAVGRGDFTSGISVFEYGAKSFDTPDGRDPAYRFRLFYNWVQQTVLDWEVTKIVYEQPFISRFIDTELALGMATRVKEICAVRYLKHDKINVKSLKKYATGSGNAKKPDMSAAAKKICPDYRDNMERDKGGDVADAILVLHYFLCNPDGPPKPVRKPRNKKMVDILELPAIPGDSNW